MFLTPVLLISATIGWGTPATNFDTAYALELDEQYDEARQLYQDAVVSPTEPLDAHLGLIRISDKDPLETVPIYPQNHADSLAYFLHLFSTECAAHETAWIKWEKAFSPLHDTFLKNLVERYPSIPHPRLMLVRRLMWGEQRPIAVRLMAEARDTFLGHPVFDHDYVELLNIEGSKDRARAETLKLMDVFAKSPIRGFFEYVFENMHRGTKDYDTILARAEPSGHLWRDNILLTRAGLKFGGGDTDAAIRYCRMVLNMGWNDSMRDAASLLSNIYDQLKRETEAIEVLADYEQQYGGRHKSLGYSLVQIAKRHEWPDSAIIEYCKLGMAHMKSEPAYRYYEDMIRRDLAGALLRANRTAEAVEHIELLRASAKSRLDKFEALTLLYRAHLQLYPSVLTSGFMTYVIALLIFPVALIYFLRLPGLTHEAKISGKIVVAIIALLQTISTPEFSVQFWSWTIFSALRNFIVVAASVTLIASTAIPLRLNRRAYLETAGLTLAGGLWTYVLYELHQPEVSHLLRAILEDLPSEFGIPLGPKFGLYKGVAYVTAGALTEELICRLLPVAIAVRSFGDRRRTRIIALGIATVAWAAAHAGMMTPEWWKFAQIVGIGIFLSLLFLRRGFVACMIAHSVFNTAVVLLHD